MRKTMRDKIAVTPGLFPTADDFSMLESVNHRTIATAEEKRNYHGGSIDSTVATISRENE